MFNLLFAIPDRGNFCFIHVTVEAGTPLLVGDRASFPSLSLSPPAPGTLLFTHGNPVLCRRSTHVLGCAPSTHPSHISAFRRSGGSQGN